MAGFLDVKRDFEPYSAAGQMAIDQSLLDSATRPAIRFYQWREPAVTIGYFVSDKDLDVNYPGLEIARRRTGGGIVEHGDDVTFAIAVPRAAAAKNSRIEQLLAAPAPDRYRWIHDRLVTALNACGIRATVADPENLDSQADLARCFAGPVLSDVIDPETGKKIAGGAQRRSREGWLHQGSVRLDAPDNVIDAPWTAAFCKELELFQGLPD